MFIQISHSNGLAVYDQIVRQVKYAVADGAIRKEELVPSVRELARDLAINPNTVARAYRQLQDESVLQTVPGRGLAVSEGAKKLCRSERTQLIRARLREVVEEAANSGLSSEEIEKLLLSELKRRK